MLKKLKFAIMPAVAIAMVYALSAFTNVEEAKKAEDNQGCFNSQETQTSTFTTCVKGTGNCVSTSCPSGTHSHP